MANAFVASLVPVFSVSSASITQAFISSTISSQQFRVTTPRRECRWLHNQVAWTPIICMKSSQLLSKSCWPRSRNDRVLSHQWAPIPSGWSSVWTVFLVLVLALQLPICEYLYRSIQEMFYRPKWKLWPACNFINVIKMHTLGGDLCA